MATEGLEGKARIVMHLPFRLSETDFELVRFLVCYFGRKAL